MHPVTTQCIDASWSLVLVTRRVIVPAEVVSNTTGWTWSVILGEEGVLPEGIKVIATLWDASLVCP